MEIGFFFWPFDVALVHAMADAADAFGYDMIGIADTPGNAMDPWVAATLVAERVRTPRISLCVTNVVTRHPAVSAAATASIDLLAPGRVVLGIGVGHSGVMNLGGTKLAVAELPEAVIYLKQLLSGTAASYRGEPPALLSWVKRSSPVFLAASHPRSLRTAGATADGVFINYGIAAENIAESEALVREAAVAAGRRANDVEMWQIAALDCSDDGATSRRKLGAILAFVTAYIVGNADPARRGVPVEHQDAVRELRRRFSTRPGDADAALVKELGLLDYLSGRLAVCGTPEECLAQARRAQAAGAKRLMFTVSLAADPLGTVRVFGEKVLPQLRRR